MRSHATIGHRDLRQEPRCFNTASGMRSHATKNPYRIEKREGCFNTASGMRSHATPEKVFASEAAAKFQYRKRYEGTCDSVPGRPQKQKAQKVVLENLLESERLREFFDSHYILIEYVMTSPRLIFQGLWRFEENRKTYPVFMPPGRFPFFAVYHRFSLLSNLLLT